MLEESELKINFPITYNYLLKHKQELAKRKDSRKSFDNKSNWFSLTRFGQKNIYNKIKIVSPGEVKEHKFCIDYSQSAFSCARVFAITVDEEKLNLKYVLGLLNSNLIKFFIQSRASLKAGGYYSYSSNVLNQVPIHNSDLKSQNLIGSIVNEIMLGKKQGQQTKDLEQQIDVLVYKLYDLTPDEIAIVEGIVIKEINEAVE